MRTAGDCRGGGFAGRLPLGSTPVPACVSPSVITPLGPAAEPAGTARDGPTAGRTPRLPDFLAVAFQREVDEAVDERDVVEARGLPHPRVSARRREAGDRVDLVDEEPLTLEEEVDARHAAAVDRPEGRDPQLLHPTGVHGPDGRGHHDFRLAVGVLRGVVVPLRGVADLGRDRGHGIVVAEHADFDLTPEHGALDQHLAVVPRGFVERDAERLRVMDFADADAGAEVRRLHEVRKAELARDTGAHGGGILTPLPTRHHEVLDDRQAVGAEDGLHGGFVHAHGGGQHAGADVGNVSELEESLDRPVLAVRAVEHDDDDVEALAQFHRQAPCRLGPRERGLATGQARLRAVRQRLLDVTRRVAGGQPDARLRGERPQRIAAHHPAAVARDAERYHLMAAALQRGDDRGGGRQRDLVLSRAAAEDDADTQRRHGAILAGGAGGHCACSAMRNARAIRLPSHLRLGSQASVFSHIPRVSEIQNTSAPTAWGSLTSEKRNSATTADANRGTNAAMANATGVSKRKKKTMIRASARPPPCAKTDAALSDCAARRSSRDSTRAMVISWK